MSDFSLSTLKGSVIDLAAKCKDLRLKRNELRQQRRSGNLDPYLVWDDGSEVRMIDLVRKRATRGYCSRYHQLAYAFARGRAYERTEQKVRPGNEPSAMVIADILMQHLSGSHPEEMRAALESKLSKRLESWLTTRGLAPEDSSQLAPAAA